MVHESTESLHVPPLFFFFLEGKKGKRDGEERERGMGAKGGRGMGEEEEGGWERKGEGVMGEG